MAIESEKQYLSSDSTIIRIVDNIKKSESDSWNYLGLELSNEMLVVLISHPKIDKAVAALYVKIGSLADPRDVSGIAHFLEYMLFMGSSKYPDENEYSKLIEENGGYSNASTGVDHTNDYFDINPSLLPDALDIFGQFFISPPFAASLTDRELEAVNSEYKGKLFKHHRRIYQLEKSASDPKHSYSGFSTGNTESLRTTPKQLGIDIRQVLLNFHQTEYLSNRMSLAVFESLDELQSLVIKSFKDIENNKLEKAKYPSDPYGETKRKTICYYVPVIEQHLIRINWVIPDYRELYYCNHVSYVSHLIGHKGDGSLLLHLKELGPAIGLVACRSNFALGFDLFFIDIELTIQGLKQWEQVLYSVYQYLAMLRKEGPKEWIFNECKSISEMHFQFREKEDPCDFVSNLAGRMRDYPLIECLLDEYEMREFRPDLINKLLNEYLIPTKMRVFLEEKDCKSIVTEKEKWYGTEYKEEYLSEEFIKQCETCEIIDELHLPTRNEFIPTDFQLFSEEKNLTRPQISIGIKENEYYHLYYADDSYYKLPKAFIYFEFLNPLVSVDLIHYNMNRLYIELIEDHLTELVYTAQLGGLYYELSYLYCGIKLDDLPDEILIHIFRKLYNFEVLYSLIDVNQRLNRIVHDTIFTHELCLLEYLPDNKTSSPLSDPILDRFCSKILPEIGHQIKTLHLEQTSMERILHASNFPNLNNLSLYHVDTEVAMSLFDGKNPLTHIFKNQISSFFINLNNIKDSFPRRIDYPIVFKKILTIFINLRCLKFNPSPSYFDAVSLDSLHETPISSTLLELHINALDMQDCLDILDGRFDQLRILYVTVSRILFWVSGIGHEQKPLPNLRIFSLYCKEKIHDFDKSIVPLLRRMLNLEELHLNIIVECNGRFIDGDTLMKDIIIYMPQLYKFTFNICSIINHCDQMNFPLNEHIEKTYEYFYNNEIITCIDHFQEEEYSQCHIYSYPYKWKVYDNITNNFRGGLFTCVTEISLYDERPFEDEFFLRIAQSFPFMKDLTITNRKAQNNKQLIKSNNDCQMLSIIEYSNLTRLDLTNAHDDYLELFLFDRRMTLSNNIHLRVNYQSLVKVTYNFTRYTKSNNCANLAALYFCPVDKIDENFKKYFPRTSMRCPVDFILCK